MIYSWLDKNSLYDNRNLLPFYYGLRNLFIATFVQNKHNFLCLSATTNLPNDNLLIVFHVVMSAQQTAN